VHRFFGAGAIANDRRRRLQHRELLFRWKVRIAHQREGDPKQIMSVHGEIIRPREPSTRVQSSFHFRYYRAENSGALRDLTI
jgi:hypothetical protein